MPRRLQDAVAVITGASSGIGEATALAMADRRARLVLAARDPSALDRVAEACASRGAETLAVPTDVADPEAVDALAERAAERFGSIDVWVNNAGVILYGRVEETPPEAFRRVIETNFLGQVHGARAAVRHFRRQASGVLINMSSVWARVSSPHVSAYVASKHAVRAFSACLREELRGLKDVHVVTVLPQAVDTPMFRHAGNFTRRKVRCLPLARPAEDIAKRIVWCAEDPKREVTERRFGRLLELAQSAAPPLFEAIAPRLFPRLAYSNERAEETTGNLFEPLH